MLRLPEGILDEADTIQPQFDAGLPLWVQAFEVLPDPARMQALGLSVQKIKAAVEANNRNDGAGRLGAEGGATAASANCMHGLEDDFAVFGSALQQADVAKLAGGTSPTSITGSAKLIGYWNFNDKPATVPTLVLTKTATGMTLTFTGTLQSTTSITGPWADETATSPAAITFTGTQRFFRAKQ